MRIALVYLGRKGAGPIYAYEMAKALKHNGNDVVAFISTTVENVNSWNNLGIELCKIDTYNSTLSYLFQTIKFRICKLKQIALKYQEVYFDAIYIPMIHPWNDMIARKLKSKKYLYTIHDPRAHSSNLSFKLKLFELYSNIVKIGLKKRNVTDYIILSNCFKEYVMKKYNTKNVYVIPHAIFDFYQKESLVGYHYYDSSKTNFVFFGRIDEYKGLHLLANAYKKVSEIYGDGITLSIIGSGDFSPYKDEYEKLKNVDVINRWIKDEEVNSFFNPDANLIVVLPYIDATQSGVIPIAMNSKVLCIASDCGGLPEQIEDGVTGILFKTNSASDLKNKMIEAIENSHYEMINNAYNYIKSLTWDNSAIELEKIIGGN